MEHKKEHHVFEFGCLRLNILKAPLTLWRRLPNGNSDQSFHNHTKKLLTFWEKIHGQFRCLPLPTTHSRQNSPLLER